MDAVQDRTDEELAVRNESAYFSECHLRSSCKKPSNSVPSREHRMSKGSVPALKDTISAVRYFCDLRRRGPVDPLCRILMPIAAEPSILALAICRVGRARMLPTGSISLRAEVRIIRLDAHCSVKRTICLSGGVACMLVLREGTRIRPQPT